MNVLVSVLKYPPDYTGAGLRLHTLYQHLKTKGVGEVYVLTTGSRASMDGKGGKDAMLDGIAVTRVVRNPYPDRQRGARRIRKALLVCRGAWGALWAYRRVAGRIDVVHTIDSSWLTTLVGWCAFLTRKPLVKEIVLMDADDPVAIRRQKPLLLRWFFLFPFRYARLIVTISAPLRDRCLAYGLSAQRIWSRPNPVYLAAPEGGRGALELPREIDRSRPAVLWVGTIKRRKNLLFLLRAAFTLEGEAQLVFVGPREDPAYFDEVQALARRLAQDTQGRIQAVFLDRLDDRARLRRLYEHARLFWFASRSEGMGNVVVEALLCGTPVVALPVQGIMRTLLMDRLDGDIVEREDPELFGRVVNDCLYHRPFNRRLIADRARARFDAQAIEAEYGRRLQAAFNNA